MSAPQENQTNCDMSVAHPSCIVNKAFSYSTRVFSIEGTVKVQKYASKLWGLHNNARFSKQCQAWDAGTSFTRCSKYRKSRFNGYTRRYRDLRHGLGKRPFTTCVPAYVGARNLVTLSYEELHDQRIIQRPNMLQRARWLGALQPRAMEFSSQPSLNHATHADTRNRRRAFIALGSNIGDRFKNIERACNLMNEMGHIKVLRTSGLWETTPMYVVDQELFLNGVCEVSYSLSSVLPSDALQHPLLISVRLRLRAAPSSSSTCSKACNHPSAG